MTTEQITKPILAPGEGDTLANMVYQAIGAASVCWTDMAGQGVFMSERAEQIAAELIGIIDDTVREQEIEPLLDHLDLAWIIIANASDWASIGDERWVPFAEQWRDKWHKILDDYSPWEIFAEETPTPEGTLVIETTRKGKYVRSYGPFTPQEAGEFALSKIESQTLNGGRHDFMLDSLPELSRVTLVHPPKQTTLTLDEFLSWLDEVVVSTEPAQWSTADLDQRDRFPNRPLTADDVAFPNDPWPGSGRHREPWGGN